MKRHEPRGEKIPVIKQEEGEITVSGPCTSHGILIFDDMMTSGRTVLGIYRYATFRGNRLSRLKKYILVYTTLEWYIYHLAPPKKPARTRTGAGFAALDTAVVYLIPYQLPGEFLAT